MISPRGFSLNDSPETLQLDDTLKMIRVGITKGDVELIVETAADMDGGEECEAYALQCGAVSDAKDVPLMQPRSSRPAVPLRYGCWVITNFREQLKLVKKLLTFSVLRLNGSDRWMSMLWTWNSVWLE